MYLLQILEKFIIMYIQNKNLFSFKKILQNSIEKTL